VYIFIFIDLFFFLQSKHKLKGQKEWVVAGITFGTEQRRSV